MEYNKRNDIIYCVNIKIENISIDASLLLLVLEWTEMKKNSLTAFLVNYHH